jgi:predicted kinase
MIAIPQAPDWSVDWKAIDREYEWVRAMAGCPQDPRHHAEGDVWIHTEMVCRALAALPEWRALDEKSRALVFWAALLHDVAKPLCTRTEPDGRISSRGHSRRGEILARRILWQSNMPFSDREQIVSLIRFHQIPFYLIDRDDRRRLAIQVSQSARCDWLALVAEADMRGRVAPDQARILDNVALFVEHCRDEGCLDRPRPFADDETRFTFFRRDGRDPDVPAHADRACDVVLLSGLPAMGKDRFIAGALPGWPVVSLDDLRRELDVDPGDGYGAIAQAARERARVHLRDRRSFVFNATNLTRDLRRQWIDLFAAYRARVRIVYVECSPSLQRTRNRARDARVPEAVVERMLDRWEVPDLTEAHRVDFVVEE